METFSLLEKYLKEHTAYELVHLNDYTINGSIIKLTYYYNPAYEWDKDYWKYDNIMEIEILDYITWVYNLCNCK